MNADTDRYTADPQQSRLLRVCRIGRAQGLKGEVNVFAYTDEPERRFSPGSVLTQPEEHQSFTVESSRRFKSRWIVHFTGVDNRTAAESLTGIELYVQAELLADNTDDDAWYLEDLVGLDVRMAAGNTLGRPANEQVGRVSAVIDSPAQQLLEVQLTSSKHGDSDDGTDVTTGLVPFVEELVPEVNPEEGYILIDPPKGLLSLPE
ncbi:ribosome maturation factor RimM [Bombiscardovia coagulans]|uniref:Ribosome maturation factor RimM n=1 Tax=Bombiscardovia coagulans TaxID=686666 RepID=A0A261EV20_9BIFI|nr:ribosome maturation factor RimM [Bombiscardovia coagulans]OZG50677.1 ribosome maturation protein RimM [Bombiscardovia coagulans]